MIKRAAALLLLAIIGGIFFTLLTGYTADESLNLTARYYAENTAKDIGAANIVTAIIVTYRGLDTLGEVTVLFLAAAIVGLVLARSRKADEAVTVKAPVGELLTTGSHSLLPLILLLELSIFLSRFMYKKRAESALAKADLQAGSPKD